MGGLPHKQRHLVHAGHQPTAGRTPEQPLSLLLVPYLPHHVPTYHEWMGRPELLEATASEPLTLEEEYANQRSWSQDPLKWTFILLLPPPPPMGASPPGSATDQVGAKPGHLHHLGDLLRSPSAMVGDVNLFLHDADAMGWMTAEMEATENGDGASFTYPAAGPVPKVGELEIMIAVPHARRRGLGALAVQCMIRYAWEHLGVRHFFVQVQQGNTASIALFRSLGFRMHGPGPNVFGEVVLIRSVQADGGLVGSPFHYHLEAYPES